jgi:superfamily II RNA helicase
MFCSVPAGVLALNELILSTLQIMKLVPDIFEGSLVRVMRRLEELLRRLAGVLRALFDWWCWLAMSKNTDFDDYAAAGAAKSIGDDELEAKMVAGQEKLKRDTVIAASLYL